MNLTDDGNVLLHAFRHPDFSSLLSNKGRPTDEGLKESVLHASPLIQRGTIVATGRTLRQLLSAQELCQRHGLREPRVFPEFDAVTTANIPSLLGGWLYDRLHRSRRFNRFCLIEWGRHGAPLFRETVPEVLERVKSGVARIMLEVTEVNAEHILLYTSQEIIMLLEYFLNGLPLDQAFRLEIPHSTSRSFILNKKR